MKMIAAHTSSIRGESKRDSKKIPSKDQLDSANIKKSGYLVKMASRSARNWKKRYFVLNDSALIYYADHLSTDYPKGEISFTAGASIEEYDKNETGRAYCLIVKSSHGVQLVVAAKDQDEMLEWKEAIQTSISKCNSIVRGYAFKLDSNNSLASMTKYFILNSDILTYHSDHSHTNAIQGMIKIAEDTVLNVDENAQRIEIVDSKTNEA